MGGRARIQLNSAPPYMLPWLIGLPRPTLDNIDELVLVDEVRSPLNQHTACAHHQN